MNMAERNGAPLMEKKQQRMLNKDGVFVSRDVTSPHNDSLGDLSARDGIRPRLEGETVVSESAQPAL